MTSTSGADRPVTVVRGYLESQGLRVMDQNWRHDSGQIDLVAADRDVLVACAVRVRNRRVHRDPLTLPPPKIRALRRLALRWQQVHGARFGQVRVDVTQVTWEGTGGYTIEHVKAVG